MSHLNIAEAVPLGYALVARVASDAGVRALCIKGPLTTELGARRTDHESQDVDVLVAPEGRQQLLHALRRSGWNELPAPATEQFVRPHSVQCTHPGLGIEVDVHHSYPGMLAAADDSFDALWERRREWRVAGVAVPAANTAASYLIELLHLARDVTRNRRRLDNLIGRMGAEIDAVLELAAATGAHSIVNPLLGTDVTNGAPEDPRAQLDWERRQRAGSAVGARFVEEFRSASAGRRASLVARQVWPPLWKVTQHFPETPMTLRGKLAGRLRLLRLNLRRAVIAVRNRRAGSSASRDRVD